MLFDSNISFRGHLTHCWEMAIDWLLFGNCGPFYSTMLNESLHQLKVPIYLTVGSFII